MKKKVLAAACILAGICFIGVAAVLLYIFTPAVGTYINAGGSPAVLLDSAPTTPVLMESQAGDNGMFAGLQTGDRVVIVHDNIMLLNYPEQLRVYLCIRLRKGDETRIPESVTESLREMGWL